MIGEPEHPIFRDRGISYLHIPAADPSRSFRFYGAVYWRVAGTRAHPGFEDGSGRVLVRFTTGQAAVGRDGIRPYVYVPDIDAVLARIGGHGGKVACAPYPEGDLWVATFADPAGNHVGVWQRGPRG